MGELSTESNACHCLETIKNTIIISIKYCKTQTIKNNSPSGQNVHLGYC